MITNKEKELLNELFDYKPEEGDSINYFRHTIK